MTTVLTPAQVAAVATQLAPDTLEAAVTALAPEVVPEYLVRVDEAVDRLHALRKALEQRLVADGQTGGHFTVDGREYAFYGSQQKGFRDLPGLFNELVRTGLTWLDLADAISDTRVTDLRTAAGRIIDDGRRAEALDAIEEHRIPKGARGAPHLQMLDAPYRK